jgi:ribonuclease-3
LEAALGALYLDGGLDAARNFVRRAWDEAMTVQAEPPKDAKTALQDWAQKRGKDLPVYEVTGRSGPPHAPEFTVTVTVGVADGIGSGGSKRAAEQHAAEALLARLQA